LYAVDALIGGFRVRTANQLSLEGMPKYMEELKNVLKSEQLTMTIREKLRIKQHKVLCKFRRFLIKTLSKIQTADIVFNRNMQEFEIITERGKERVDGAVSKIL
jgi:hypothetical protein